MLGVQLPYSKAIVTTVLAFVTAIGGYGGYNVYKGDPVFGTLFESRLHTVTNVLDGDTIIVDDDVRVRLIGIDAPEMGTCYGEESHNYLTKLLLDQKVELRKDRVAVDQYDRLLRYVFLHNEDPKADNLLINQLVVKEGYAQAYYTRDNNQYYNLIIQAENSAVEHNKGMWSECDYKQKRVDDDSQESVDTFNKECHIKGNVSRSGGKDKRYFMPGCQSYNNVKVDPTRGEAWFCTEAEAQKAGFVKGTQCPE